MSKKALKLGAASILALGAGAAVVSKKNKRDEQRKATKDIQERAHKEFRNTERGKYTKNIEIQNVESMIKIVKEYIILMVIMKHLQDRKNRKELMINQLIL